MKCERRLNLSLGICVVSLLAAVAIDHQWETIEAAMLMNVWRLMFTCVYKGKSKVRSAISHDLKMAKRDLSGNTVWPQASGLQKIPKMDHFRYFCETFVHSKCNFEWDFFCGFQSPCFVYPCKTLWEIQDVGLGSTLFLCIGRCSLYRYWDQRSFRISINIEEHYKFTPEPTSNLQAFFHAYHYCYQSAVWKTELSILLFSSWSTFSF